MRSRTSSVHARGMDVARTVERWWPSLRSVEIGAAERRHAGRRFAAHERRLTAQAARPTLLTLTAASALSLSLAVDAGPHGLPPIIVVLAGAQIALGLTSMVLLPRLRTRHHGLLVFAAMLLALQAPIVTMSQIQGLVISTYAYLMIIPMGIAVFLPWSARVHALWLVGYGITVIELLVLLDRPSAWPLASGDVLGPLIVVGAVSLVGNIVAGRRRRESFARYTQAMRLRRQVRRENVRIQTLSDRSAADARTDALTRVANRFALEEDLTIEAVTAAVSGSVLMIDIDHFKALNDRLGHAAGDVALQRVAGALGATLRDHDRLYRYGGEEFVVRLDGMGPRSAMVVADRLRLAVRHLAIPNPGSPSGDVVTVSVGVATLDRSNPIGAIGRADAALYAAKQAGRDRVMGWSSAPPPTADDRAALASP